METKRKPPTLICAIGTHASRHRLGAGTSTQEPRLEAVRTVRRSYAAACDVVEDGVTRVILTRVDHTMVQLYMSTHRHAVVRHANRRTRHTRTTEPLR